MTDSQINLAMNSNLTGEKGSLIPAITPSYVPWGHFDDVEKFVRNNDFTTLYVTGLSGNGKTTMVEQACANASRECIRANITAETDEDDLIGGFRLHNGSTVFVYGAAIEAMKRGAVLLLDEVDLASERIMCLQPVLEGKGYLHQEDFGVRAPCSGVYDCGNCQY